MDGKIVLVTGAASGIGLAAATGFARLGASIWALARNDERAGQTARLTRARTRSGRVADVRPVTCHLSSLAALLAFTTCSLDAPLAHSDDPALLGDILGEDDLALSHATDIDAVYAYLDELPECDQRILMVRFYGNLTSTQPNRKAASGRKLPSKLD
jgi:NAD(P)-dependent dehydrogenase (short-subunit alcohol dehydrogenase family)